MIYPEKKDLIAFVSSVNTAGYKKWLLAGIKKYVHNNSIWGFEPIAVFMGQDEHIVLDLRNVYRLLKKSQQKYFRRAVLELLQLPVSKKNIRVLEILVLFSEQIQCTEALDVLRGIKEKLSHIEELEDSKFFLYIKCAIRSIDAIKNMEE